MYLARDPAVPRTVALKVIPRDEEESRFHREVRAAAQLAHPNIVRLFDVGEEPDFLYYTMEYVDGPSLARVLKDTRPLPPRTAMRVARDVARALSHAHERGIIHRDIKPGNILLVAESPIEDAPPSDSALAIPRGFVAEYRAVLADFGLAREVRAATALTISGDVLGTPLYMSPEQAGGQAHQVDARADVYSLGAVLYEMLTGALPSAGRTTLEVLEAVRTREPVAPRRIVPELSRDAETIVMKALAKERQRRYPTAAEFADDIERYLRGEAVRARPASLAYRARKAAARRPALTGVAVTFLLLVGGLLAWQLGPATLDLNVTGPERFRVTVDGRPAEVPSRIWPAVRTRLLIEADGYHPVEGTWDLDPWRTLTITVPMELDHGWLKLDVAPAEARVTVLDVAGNAAPVSREDDGRLRVPVGLWRVRAEADRHEPVESIYSISPGADLKVALSLPERRGMLVVTTAAAGARMRVTPHFGESTPVEYSIPVGRYDARTTIELQNGSRIEGRLLEESEESVGIELSRGTMTFRKAHVARIMPPGFRDGLLLPVGQYRLTFEADNHFTREAEVEIRAGATASVNATLNPQELWRFKTDGPVTGRPALADLNGDGDLDAVFGSHDNNVYAVSGRDGSVLWRVATRGWIYSSPALGDLDGDGTPDAVVGSDDNHVYALSGRDGSILWRAATAGEVWSSPALGDLDGDGTLDVVVGSRDKHIYALCGRDGSILWQVATQGEVGSTALGDLDGDEVADVLVGSNDNYVYALSGHDGPILWRAATTAEVWSSPALADLDGDGVDDAVVGSNDKYVHAFSGFDGSILWRAATQGPVNSSPALGDLDSDGVDDAVVGSVDKHVYALSGRDGSILWRAATQGEVWSSPALGDLDGDGTLDAVVGSGDNDIYAFSGRDGSILWRAATQEPVVSSPALSDLDGDGVTDAVVGSWDKHVYALSGLPDEAMAKSGRKERVLWRIATQGPILSSPTLSDLDGDGTPDAVVGAGENVYAISGRKGSILWRAATPDGVDSVPALSDLDADGVADAVVGAWSAHVYAFSGRDGSILWRAATPGPVSTSPALSDLDADGVADAVVASGDGHVYALSGRDGSILWRSTMQGPTWSSPAIGAHEVILGAGDDVVALPLRRPLPDALAAARRDLAHGLPRAAERHAARGIAAAPTASLHLTRAEARFALANWTGALDDVAAARLPAGASAKAGAAGVVSPESAMIHLLASLRAGREPDAALVADGVARGPFAFAAALVAYNDALEDADGYRAALRRALAIREAAEREVFRDETVLMLLLGDPAAAERLAQLVPKGDLDPVRFDYSCTLGVAALTLFGGDAHAIDSLRALAGQTVPGARFKALWPTDAAELRNLLRLPEAEF